MSVSLSIFQKLCPACATSVPVGAERCECGHIFEGAADATQDAEQQALRDEELYENYLAARALQAQEATRAAEEAYSESPHDDEKLKNVELAREVAKSLDADLGEQHARVARLRATVAATARMKPAATLPALNPAPALPPRPVAAKPAPAKPVPAAKPVAAKPAAAKPVASKPAVPAAKPARKPQPSATKPAKPAAAVFVPSTPAVTRPRAMTGVYAQNSDATRKAAGVLEAIKQAKAREEAAHTGHTVQTAVAPPAPAVSTVPPPTFRAEQAARAEKALESRRAADTKECPNCTSGVPINTSRCRCGYAFTGSGDDLPSLTLCTGDFTALRNSLNLNLPKRS